MLLFHSLGLQTARTNLSERAGHQAILNFNGAPETLRPWIQAFRRLLEVGLPHLDRFLEPDLRGEHI